MSRARLAELKLTLCRSLLIATLPAACAVGVEPELEPGSEDAGSSSAGGSRSHAGSAGSLPLAGTTTSSAGTSSNPFGGTASSGSKGGSGAAGGAKGGSGGNASGGSGGNAGGAGGVGGSAGAAGNPGSGSCACPKTLSWVDNTNISFGPGDCLSLGTKTYLYTGQKAQTYANVQCNPGKQEAWCTDSGNDYKFMSCN